MLNPDEWDELYAKRRRIARRLPRKPTKVEAAALTVVDSEIALHNDGSDPLAPFGGIRRPDKGTPFAGTVLSHFFTTVESFRQLKTHKTRTLYFSLVCNSSILMAIFWSLHFYTALSQLVLRWGPYHHHPKSDLSLSVQLHLIDGSVVLALLALVVLQLERRAVRARWRKSNLKTATIGVRQAPAEHGSDHAEGCHLAVAADEPKDLLRLNR